MNHGVRLIVLFWEVHKPISQLGEYLLDLSLYLYSIHLNYFVNHPPKSSGPTASSPQFASTVICHPLNSHRCVPKTSHRLWFHISRESRTLQTPALIGACDARGSHGAPHDLAAAGSARSLRFGSDSFVFYYVAFFARWPQGEFDILKKGWEIMAAKWEKVQNISTN